MSLKGIPRMRIYDNGGKTADRYTVVPMGAGYIERRWQARSGLDWTWQEERACLGMSANPTHPQGFSQWSTCQDGPHLGTRISWSKLPDNIRQHIRSRLSLDFPTV